MAEFPTSAGRDQRRNGLLAHVSRGETGWGPFGDHTQCAIMHNLRDVLAVRGLQSPHTAFDVQ